MPFAVTQWALSPDPRPADYIVFGWDFGQMSPWQWILSTTGATGDLAVFNAGVLCVNIGNGPGFGDFAPVDPLPTGLALIFFITGTQLPAGGPPTFTNHINLQLFDVTLLLYDGDLRQTYPTAIQVQTPIIMNEFDTSRGTLPNPMKITPAKWNA